MSERKNIDTFFKERLEHAEVAPPEMAWENIELQLNAKKKKRRVVPFWWRFSGVAALLVVGSFLFGPYPYNGKQNNPESNPQNSIVTKEKNNANASKTTAGEKNNTLPNQNQSGVAVQENNTTNTPTSEDNSSATSVNKNNSPVSETQRNNRAVVASPNSNRKNSVSGLKILNSNNNDFNTNEANTNASNQRKSKNSSDAIAAYNKKIESQQKTVPNTENNTPLAQSNSNSNTTQNATQKTTETPAKNTIENTTLKNTDAIAETKNPVKTPEEIKKKDSTNLAVVEPNALEELLNEKEKKIAKGRKENRWQVTPNIAPIYFSSISNGSPLDEKLADNEKIYGTNFSYGVSVNYALNKKLQIRSGINTFSADYDTKNIVFYQNTNASRMQNVTPNLQGSVIQIDPLNNVTQSFGRIIEEKFEGTLNQRMGYIEMPLEVSYKLIAKKFGVDLIGGFSTLFLNQNDVYLKTTGLNMKIGEANNLNNIHFSTNIGLGLKYSFFKRFDARVEPVFKYQLNTYSSGAGSFKPYVFGVYSGISYHF